MLAYERSGYAIIIAAIYIPAIKINPIMVF